ncbi:MAG: tRNA-dihydrouridine synthase [Candidatus Tokpelaia hoelldobleri]|uniref:tRNA-dihydrouridine synthase n=1 Tax=Candidatus Tokpelaia hoelldobleri TaxID=1902579 RepID=A0A1U9JV82_9HYPH|nr:MAG: tRNA-dihydrouridine synthase [Candidatus Tokpelaia hoelldoblerii]
MTIRNRIFAAPMSGVSDLPFRQRAWQAGAGMVVSEMVASGELGNGHKASLRRLKHEATGPCVVQLAGCRADWMAQAARIAVDEGADVVDINMGCPAKKVIGGLSGAALMRDVPHALSLIEAVVKAVPVPVTLKMRLGWDETMQNAPALAWQAEQAGVKMITVHGRTRMQLYTGKADWQAVRAVREAISVPLVVNGDIKSREDAVRAMDISGADAVMIGRASYGRPWAAGEIAGHALPCDLSAYILAHYEAMLEYYGEHTGMRHARKHLDWYLQRHCAGRYTAEERTALVTATDIPVVKALLEKIFARRQENSRVA